MTGDSRDLRAWRLLLPVVLALSVLGVRPVAAVGDPVWELPAQDVAAAAFAPRLVSSADGLHLTAVWLRTVNGKRIVATRSSSDGGANWGPAVDLSTSGQNARDHDVAMSVNGSGITVVWSRFDGTSFIAQARSSTDGGVTWSPAVNLATDAASTRIASSSDGQILTAVWSRWNGTSDVVQARNSADGGVTWAPAFDLGTGVAPRITSSKDGSALAVVWMHPTPSLRNWLQVRSSTDGGASWTAAYDLSSADEDAGEVRMVASSNGSRLSVVWIYSTGAQWTLRARSSQDGGLTWTPTHDLAGSLAGIGSPSIVSSDDGSQVTTVWTRSDGEHWVVYVGRSVDSGVTWSASPANLTNADRNALDPRVTSSTDGQRLTAVWRRFDGSSYVAQARTSTDGAASWSPAATLSTPGQDVSPQVTSSADGVRINSLWGLSEDREGPVQAVSGVLRFAGLSANPATIDFGETQVANSVVQTVTVTNSGDGPLTIGGSAIDGPGAADFTVDVQTCAGSPVPPMGTCTLLVGFGPTSSGVRNAQLVLTSNAVGSPHTVALRGTGVSPASSVSPTATPDPSATPTPTVTPTPGASQSVRVPIKSGEAKSSAKLPKTTNQGSPLVWKSATKKVCKIKAGRVRFLRKGTCRLKGTAVATGGYRGYSTTVRVRVK
jgi:hypothetical protein